MPSRGATSVSPYQSPSSTPSPSPSKKPKNTIASRIQRNSPNREDTTGSSNSNNNNNNGNNNNNTEVYEQDAWRRQLQIQELLQALRPQQQQQKQQQRATQTSDHYNSNTMGNEASSTAAAADAGADGGATEKALHEHDSPNQNNEGIERPLSPAISVQSAASSNHRHSAAAKSPLAQQQQQQQQQQRLQRTPSFSLSPSVTSPTAKQPKQKQKKEKKRGRLFARRLGGSLSSLNSHNQPPESPSVSSSSQADRDREEEEEESSTTTYSSLRIPNDSPAESPEQVFERHVRAAAAAASPTTPSASLLSPLPTTPTTPSPRKFDKETERPRSAPEQRLRQLKGRFQNARRHSSSRGLRSTASSPSSSSSLSSPSSNHHSKRSPANNPRSRTTRSISEYDVLPVLQSIPSMEPSTVDDTQWSTPRLHDLEGDDNDDDDEDNDTNGDNIDSGSTTTSTMLGWQSDSARNLSQFLDARQEQPEEEDDIVSGDATQSQSQQQQQDDDDNDNEILPRESFLTSTGRIASWSDQEEDEVDDTERHEYYQLNRHEDRSTSFTTAASGPIEDGDEDGGGNDGPVAAVRSVMTGVLHPKVMLPQLTRDIDTDSPPPSPTQAPTPSPTPYNDNDNDTGQNRPVVQIESHNREMLAVADLNNHDDSEAADDDNIIVVADASPTEELSSSPPSENQTTSPIQAEALSHGSLASSVDLPDPNENPLLEGLPAREESSGSSGGGGGNNHNNDENDNGDDNESTHDIFHASCQDESEHADFSEVEEDGDTDEIDDNLHSEGGAADAGDANTDNNEKNIALPSLEANEIIAARGASDDSLIQHASSLDNVVMSLGPFPQPGFPAASPITKIDRARSLDDIVVSPKASERVRAAMAAGNFSYHVATPDEEKDGADGYTHASVVFHAEVSTPGASEMLDETTVEQAVEKLATLDIVDVDEDHDGDGDDDDNNSHQLHEDEAIVNANDAPASPVQQDGLQGATSSSSVEKHEDAHLSPKSPMQAEGVPQAFDTVRQNLDDSLAAFLDEANDEPGSKGSSVAAGVADDQCVKATAGAVSVDSSKFSASAAAAAAVPPDQLNLPTLIMPGNDDDGAAGENDKDVDETNVVFHAAEMATPRAAELLGESSFAFDAGQVPNTDGATETVTFEHDDNAVEAEAEEDPANLSSEPVYESKHNEKEASETDAANLSDLHIDSEEAVPDAAVSPEESESIHESEAIEKDTAESGISGPSDEHDTVATLSEPPQQWAESTSVFEITTGTDSQASVSISEEFPSDAHAPHLNNRTTDDTDEQIQFAHSPTGMESAHEESFAGGAGQSASKESVTTAGSSKVTADAPSVDRDAAPIVEALLEGAIPGTRETGTQMNAAAGDSTKPNEMSLDTDNEATVDAATVDSWKRVVDEAKTKLLHMASTLSDEEAEETVAERDGEANHKRMLKHRSDETDAPKYLAARNNSDTEQTTPTNTETSSLQQQPNSSEDHISSISLQPVPSSATNDDSTRRHDTPSQEALSCDAVPERVEVPTSLQEDNFELREDKCPSPMMSPQSSLEPLPSTAFDQNTQASSDSFVKESQTGAPVVGDSPLHTSSGEQDSKSSPSSDSAPLPKDPNSTGNTPSRSIPLSSSLSTFGSNDKTESYENTEAHQNQDSYETHSTPTTNAADARPTATSEPPQQDSAKVVPTDPFKKEPNVSKPTILPASSSAESTQSSSHQESTVYDMPRPKNHDLLMQHASSFLATNSDFAKNSSQQTNSPSANVSLAESSITEATHPTYQDCHYFSPTRQPPSNRGAPMSVGATRYQPKSIKDLVRRDLRSSNENVVERALQQITIDCFYDQSARSLIARVGGLLAVITAMEDHSANPLIQIAACQALEKLALDADNERAVAELGGIDCILSAMMSHFDNVRLQEAAWSALQNLTCSNAYSEMPIDTSDDGMGVLVRSFQQHASHSNVAMHASATLANLCIPNEFRADQLVKSDGVVNIAKALQNHWGDRSVRNEISHSLERLCEGIASQSAET